MDTLNALPIGTVLDADYRVIRVLGAGGFGITYLAEEISLARKVAVKEYFPGEFATRDGPTVVRSRSMTYQEDYQWGLDRFIAEAQVLAKFDHPNVGRVLRYFRANNTGYMVLRFEEGKSFKAFIDRLGRPPTQGEFDAIARPLLNALELIHAQDFLHRDIAPDNIVIRDDGSPVLIDFGSARSDVADGSKAVSALVKPGYSPFEQYAANGKTQGPWTDIYALGATLYHAVAGSRPADSPTRMQSDDLKPARAVAKASYRPEFLSAIDHALRLKIDERPQNVSEWRKELFAVLETGGVARTPAGKAQSLTPAKTRKLDPEALLPKRWMKRSGGGAKAGANAALAIPLPEPDPMTIALKAEARPIAIAQAAEQKAAPANNVVQLKRPPELAAPPPVAPAAPAEPARKRPSLLSLLADVRPAPSEAAAVSPGPATPPKPVPAMKAASAKPKRAIPRVPFRIGRRMQIDLTTRLVASLAVVSAIVFHQEWMPLFGLMAKPAATVSTLSLGALPQVTDVSLQRTLRGHDKPIVGLTAGGDGQTLMSSSGDNLFARS